MKIISTIHRTVESDWKIRIAPRKQITGEYDNSLIEFWKPNKSDEGMLMFNPTISLNIKSRINRDAKTILLPITLLYSFENCLSVVYGKLNTPGLYKVEKGAMYIDAKTAEKCSKKLSVYKDNITFVPIIMYAKNAEEPIRGIRLYLSGSPVVDLQHNEVREACEILSHLDVNTYSVALAMLEKLASMDEKLDTVLANQISIANKLDSLIGMQYSATKVNDPASSFTWTVADN